MWNFSIPFSLHKVHDQSVPLNTPNSATGPSAGRQYEKMEFSWSLDVLNLSLSSSSLPLPVWLLVLHIHFSFLILCYNITLNLK